MCKRREKRKPPKLEKSEKADFVSSYVYSIKNFFPDLNNWISELKDFRQKKKCAYKIKEIIILSLILLSFIGSRRNYNIELNKIEAKEFLNKAFKLNLISIPNGDTLAYFWNNFDKSELEKLIYKMLNKLLRNRQLEKYRLGIYYLVAIDGTELYRFSERHCQNCLYQKINDQRQYFHRVLEAKIVTSNGLAISLATEFIENKEDKEFDKQDCELKAFYRLEKKIKKLFPRLKICLLLDALYANANVIRICKENDWKYIITFKEGNLKTVWEDFNGLFVNRETAIGAKLKLPEINYKETMYRWINEIEYSDCKINILAKYFNQELVRAFITNLIIDEKNLFKIEAHGQLRWKIENQGFDCQKNHGYNLEHLYTKNPNGIKVVYLLIQIAHIINQLFLKADILKVCSNALSTKALSIKYIFSKILDGILLGWINEFELIFKKLDNRKFQLRFNTS